MNIDQIRKWVEEWSGVVGVVLSPFFAWLFTRDRRKTENAKISAEKDSIVVQSTEKLIKQWEDFYKDIKKDYKELQTVNNDYSKQIDLLLKKIREFEHKLDALEEYTHNLQNYTKELEEYTSEIKNAVELLVLEIEKTNPDFALDKRNKIKESLEKLSNAKKPETTLS